MVGGQLNFIRTVTLCVCERERERERGGGGREREGGRQREGGREGERLKWWAEGTACVCVCGGNTRVRA